MVMKRPMVAILTQLLLAIRSRFTRRARLEAENLLLLDDHQAVTPTRPPPRHQQPKQPIAKTETRTARTAALEHRDLVTQRNHFQH
jgi:hypothetical protein